MQVRFCVFAANYETTIIMKLSLSVVIEVQKLKHNFIFFETDGDLLAYTVVIKYERHKMST